MPADGYMKVGFGALDALAGSVDGRNKAIMDSLDSLRRQIAGLDQLWEGSSSGAYQTDKREWNAAADHLTGVLHRIKLAVDAVNTNYQGVESANVRRFPAGG
jgi:WXG100 family type VII secretion target